MAQNNSRSRDAPISLLLLCGLCVFALQPIQCASERVLVLVSDLSLKNSHSIFFSSLTDRGYDLDYKSFADGPALREYDQWLYDKAIVLATGSPGVEGVYHQQMCTRSIVCMGHANLPNHRTWRPIDSAISDRLCR